MNEICQCLSFKNHLQGNVIDIQCFIRKTIMKFHFSISFIHLKIIFFKETSNINYIALKMVLETETLVDLT